jgi:hypothetical protein
MQTQPSLNQEAPAKNEEETVEASAELKELKPKIKELIKKYFKKEISVNDIKSDIKGGKALDEKQIHTIVWDTFEITGLSYAHGNPNKINFRIFGHEMSIEGDAIDYIKK